MLGQWEEAVKDLHKASKLDYDEEIIVALEKVGLYIFVLYHALIIKGRPRNTIQWG